MAEPEFISCNDLAKAGYPDNYDVLQRGLEALGWHYDITTDRWYNCAKSPRSKQLDLPRFFDDMEELRRLVEEERGNYDRQPEVRVGETKPSSP